MEKVVKIEIFSRIAILAVMVTTLIMTGQPPKDQRRWGELSKLGTGTLLEIPEININEITPIIEEINEQNSGQAYNEELFNDWNILTGQKSINDSTDVQAMTAEEFAEYMAYDLPVGNSTIKTMTKEATEMNPDVVGWIYIPGTKVNYPILFRRGEENFYLNYNARGKKSAAGSIFLDYTSGGKFTDLTVIHGHSMKDKTMFGSILDYKKQTWADEHSTIYVYDGTYVKEYRVFSCFVINANTEELVVGFNSKTARDLYYSRVVQRSLLDNVGIANAADVILLNTCSYEAANFRCLVYASRVSKNGK